jgi:hypothetical protein
MLSLLLTSLLRWLTSLLRWLFNSFPRPSAKGEISSPPSSPQEVWTSPPQDEFISLTPEEYKSHIDLYKFALEFAFKAISIFLVIVGAMLTFGLASNKDGKDPDKLVTSILLIATFLVNIAMIVGFDVSTYLWICLSRRVNGRVKWRNVLREPGLTWNELVIRLYSPSLVLILFITTVLFTVFSILLGVIMARRDVWF